LDLNMCIIKWSSFGSSFRLTFKFKPKLEFVDIELEEPAAPYMCQT
jgi:hypothetical protein